MQETTLSPQAAGRPARGEGRELDRSLVQGLAWTGGARGVGQLLSWASTIVIARVLTPGDYGLVGMATVYLGLVQMLNEFGLSAAIVQRRDLTRSQVERLGGLALLLSALFFLASAILAYPLALFFHEPVVRWILTALSSTFLMVALQAVPRSILSRELQFRRLAWLDAVEALAMTAATLVFALSGFRYWALVLGVISGKLASTIVALAWRPPRLAWPIPLTSIAGEVTFGWHMVVSRLAWYVYSNADFAIVGRVLGKAALGSYTIAWTIASIPVDRLTALLGNVTPSVFAAVQYDAAALRRYVRGLTEGISLLSFPACAGLALVADDFVHLALGDGWQRAVLPLRLLAIAAALRSLTPLCAQVIVATGCSRRNMQFAALAALCLPALFYVATRWGVAGVAVAWVVGHPMVAGPFLVRYACRIIEMPYASYLKALWPAASATAIMALVVLGFRAGVAGHWAPAPRLAAEILLGMAAYAAVVLPAYGSRVRATFKLLREP